MSHKEVVAKVRKLQAMTVERGASPAEAATAASLARRLVGQLAHRHEPDVASSAAYRYGRDGLGHAERHSALAPGVHVSVVSRKGLRTAGC